MPLNFNADFRGPKIDIVTREVPIAAIEKVGDILQDRYDKSYEQYNLADEALKNMEASANPVDQEKARELRTYYNAEMQGMLEKGDFHNMRHKTASLARNAALNYRIIGERNQEIQKNVDAIRKDPRYQLDPEGAVKDYLSSIKSVNINPETRTVSDYTVGTYGAPQDINISEFYLKVAPTLRTKTRKGKDARLELRKVNGKDVFFKVTQEGELEELTNTEIENELKNYSLTDPSIQNYIKRDVRRMGINPDSEEGIIAYNNLMQERTSKAAKAVGDMYSVYKDTRRQNITPEVALTDYVNGSKNQSQGSPYSPVDIFQEYKSSAGNFKELAFGALEGNKAKKSMLFGALDAMSSTNPKAKEAKQAVKALLEFSEKYPQYADNISKVTAGQTNLPVLSAAQGLYNVLNMGFNMASDFVKGIDNEQMRKDFMKVKQAYDNVASPDFIDSEFEDQFQQFSKSAAMTRSLPLKEFDITNDATRNLLDNLAKKYTINDFEIIEGGEWKSDSKNLDIMRWTDEPYGAGVGMVLEVKDKNGNSFIVQPKKQALEGLVGQIQKVNPQSNIRRTTLYKDIIPVSYENAKKSFADFAEEVDNPIVKKALMNYKDLSIVLNNGIYKLVEPNGNVRLQSTSMYDLLPRF